MKHPDIWVPRGLAVAMGMLFVGGVALAREDATDASGDTVPLDHDATNLPAASAGATTTGGSSEHATSADARESTGCAPEEPARQVRQASVPPDAAPPHDWRMGAPGTLIQLEELAPVEVIDLQKRLTALNLYNDSLDGIAGPHTRDALQAYFLKQAHLATQGQLDASTLTLFDVVPVSPASGQTPGARP